MDSNTFSMNNVERMQDYHSMFFRRKEFRKLANTNIDAILDLILRTTYVLIYSRYPKAQMETWSDVETLCQHYPAFAVCDDKEKVFLLKFRNTAKLLLMLFPGKNNKRRILDIAGRLQGSNEDFNFLKRQRSAVRRRVLIYEQEGKKHGTLTKPEPLFPESNAPFVGHDRATSPPLDSPILPSTRWVGANELSFDEYQTALILASLRFMNTTHPPSTSPVFQSPHGTSTKRAIDEKCHRWENESPFKIAKRDCTDNVRNRNSSSSLSSASISFLLTCMMSMEQLDG